MSSFGTVLIVDNDESALIELERVLEDAGFNTRTTWDVSEADRLLSTNHYDYVLVGEWFWESNAEQLLHGRSSIARAKRCMILSARSIGVEDNPPTAGPITVCKRRANDVLRALTGERQRALAHAA